MIFERRSAPIDGGEIAFFVGGNGPDLLYLHQASGFRVSEPLEKLAGNFRVWAPLMPGFDGTQKHSGVTGPKDLAQLMSRFIAQVIQPEEAIDVVGHSLGSWIGAWLAIEHAEQVDQLVLGAPAGFRAADAAPLSFEPAVMLKQLYAHPENRPAEDKTPEMIAANREAVASYGLGSSHDPVLIARAKEISCVTLILHGTKDMRVPVEAVRKLRHDIKHSQLVYIYDAAHGLEIDQPESLGNIMVDFLLRGEAFIVNPGVAQDASGARA